MVLVTLCCHTVIPQQGGVIVLVIPVKLAAVDLKAEMHAVIFVIDLQLYIVKAGN